MTFFTSAPFESTLQPFSILVKPSSQFRSSLIRICEQRHPLKQCSNMEILKSAETTAPGYF